MVAKIAMYASDQADLRSWNLLPRDLQIARFFVDPGEHTIKINMPGMGDDVAQFYQKKVVVESGKKALVTFRYMP
jgi:hypothetical protein